MRDFSPAADVTSFGNEWRLDQTVSFAKKIIYLIF